MTTIPAADITVLYVACDAGMGSSAMLASTIRKQLKKTDVEVRHVPVQNLPADARVVVTHQSLSALAREKAPGAVVVPFQLFIGDPAVAGLVSAIVNGADVHG